MKRTRLVLIGPLPPPHGGVSTFLERLALAAPRAIRIILDTGTGEDPRHRDLDIEVRQLPAGPVAAWLALREHMRDVRDDDVVVLNVSHPQGILRYLPVLTADRHAAVVLHHGTPSARAGLLGKAVELLTERLFRHSVDLVVCLTDSQAEFVRESYGVPEGSIRYSSSYVPVDMVLDDRLPPPSRPANIRVVASGEPRTYHHFDELLEVWRESGFGDQAELVICLYGPENVELESTLDAMASETSSVTVHRELDAWGFLEVLRAGDVYVRNASIDAFGIAVADAIRLGLEVVATDVCERYPGCRLIPARDREALRQALGEAIRSRSSRREGKAIPLPPREEIPLLKVLEAAYGTSTASRGPDTPDTP